MADGFSSKVAGAVSETVIKPVAGEIKNAAMIAVESITGSTTQTQDPAVQQKKQEDEQKKKNWALRVIDHYKKIQEDQLRVRQQKMQETQVKAQEEHKDEQVKQFKVMEKNQKTEDIALQRQQRSREQKGGLNG